MENVTHTPEPWKTNRKGLLTYGDLHDADGATYIGRIHFYWNARRIVACVNACAGLSTDALEAAFQEGVLLGFTRPVASEGEETARAAISETAQPAEQ